MEKELTPLQSPFQNVSPEKNSSMKQKKYVSKTQTSMNYSPANQDQYVITYTDSVLWNQSSSTWMHSTPIHSFPKAIRFQGKNSNLQLDNIHLPTTLNKRTTSLGYAQKEFIPESQLNNAKNIPSPNFYHLKDWLEEDQIARRGKSFGLGYSYYQRVYTPEMKHHPNPMFFRENPGPGSYNVVNEPGKNRKKFSLIGKGITFTQLQKSEVPASNTYHPNRVLTEASRFQKTSFGFGEKINIAKAANAFPGPGSYKLPSVFDKCRRTKKRDNF